MKNEHFLAIAMEEHQEAMRQMPRVVFFAILLLLSHVLEIQPSDFDAGGIKFAIKDVVIIRGGIALLFLWHFWRFALCAYASDIFYPGSNRSHFMRISVAKAKKPYVPLLFPVVKPKRPYSLSLFMTMARKKRVVRTISQAKDKVRWQLRIYNLLIAPFAIFAGGLMSGVILASIYDVVLFGKYLFDLVQVTYWPT